MKKYRKDSGNPQGKESTDCSIRVLCCEDGVVLEEGVVLGHHGHPCRDVIGAGTVIGEVCRRSHSLLPSTVKQQEIDLW